MVKLTIDHNPVEVQEGISVMEAAAILGISIPSMCFRPGLTNHPSCMVCLVKDLDRDHLVPSCAMPVSEGMNILTNSPEVTEARREALELLLSDHVGDCEAPCRLSCPAFMDIPLMNRLIAKGDFDQALRIVREEIALPLILGFICPAPCEKACKRKALDHAVSICLLKRSSALFGKPETSGLSEIPVNNGKKVAIIGTGPAGLSAAFYLLRSGHSCVLFDQHEKAGGAMQYEIPEDRLPKDMLDDEIGTIRKMGAEFRLGVMITREIFQNSILPGFDAAILATGSLKSVIDNAFGIQPDAHGVFIDKKNFTTTIPGVFACGNIIREQKMAVHSVAQGKMAAKQVERFLGTSKPTRKPIKFNSVAGHLSEPELKEYLKESIPDDRVEPVDGFLAGLTKEEAMHEALRCLHCDCRKPVSCKLRIYAEEYDVNRRRFAGQDRKQLTRSVQHELLVYEAEKCIRCGLCVEITEKHGESIGLGFAGRGFDVRISVPFDENIKEALTITAKECVESCPTGALAFKDTEERSSI
ncbi:MAG: 2Fe-2S iron-sulfur cluster-binding protein [Bacteroidales bacterium]|nr:2Fe-2S iron-sulfur cluster-binding protein [Bacteroidales bacterium]